MTPCALEDGDIDQVFEEELLSEVADCDDAVILIVKLSVKSLEGR